jgi:ketosteroid isomerase-like protein
MSQENVELMLAAFEAFNSGDLERIIAVSAEELEVEVPPGLSAEPDTYRGAEGMRRYMQAFQEAMSEVHFHAEQVWHGGDAVVVDVRVTARGKQTGIPVEQRAAQAWTFRDGRALRIRAYASLAEALESVGLAQ